jgi:hypothetical protein
MLQLSNSKLSEGWHLDSAVGTSEPTNHLLAVHVGAAQVLSAHHLASGGLHQRRTAQENSTVAYNNSAPSQQWSMNLVAC